MDFIDYYKVLGIAKTATEEQIKKAYRKAARKLHPDLNPNDKGAHKAFQQVNEANEVLSDPAKRAKYDKWGKDWEHGEEIEQQRHAHSQRQRQYAGAEFGGTDDGDFSGFFESMFGAAQNGSQTKYRGQDYTTELPLTLTDAMVTHQHTMNVAGKAVRITIPVGVENGQVIKLKGYGAPGANGGPSGDLYITFSITPHPRFDRVGNDLFTTATIDLYTAILGGETTVDTLNGKVKLTVKPETQHGTKVRLKGKGFPVYKKDGEAGDLFVTYNVALPTNLTEEQKALFTQLSKLN